jgi:hypothetical protein
VGFKLFRVLVSLSFIVLFFANSVDSFAGSKGSGWKGDEPFPKSPDSQLTPGTTCQRPNSQRYAERINYCERNVDRELKAKVFDNYTRLGFELLETHDRAEFKIDHYIPLCMGGSNDEENLWPQHREVYELTDPLEQESCNKMAQGRLLQKDAMRLIREAKADPSSAGRVLLIIKSL